MNEFMEYVLGGMTLGKFGAAFFFSLLGVFLSLLLSTTKRDPLSERTPTKFNWKFLWSDNAIRLYKSTITTLIVIFLSIRFAKEHVGEEASMIYSLSIGLGIDKAIEKLKSWKK